MWSFAAACCAQTSLPADSVTGPLVDVANQPQYGFDSLERLAAIGNQASYNALTAKPTATLYCDPAQTAASAQCPQSVFLVFNNLRTLVQTANELLANGLPTRFSLNITADGLGNAMRWTAAEELSAPSSAATQFGNSLASVANRITALRLGASGFSVAGALDQPLSHAVLGYDPPQALGGGASADDSGLGDVQRWGGFLNGSSGWGNHSSTIEEDAFAFDSRAVTLGADYRLNRRLVLGAAAGYSNQHIDFNSNLSVVGGRIHSDAYNLQVFGLYEWDGPYVSVSLGGQRSHYDSTRLIAYPSQNITVPSVNATATGSTTSDTFNSGIELGWSLPRGAFTIEPYLNVNYQYLHLAGFTEGSVNNMGPDAGSPAGFAFIYAPQRITTLDSAVGARFLYTLSSRFGVASIYVDAEYHHLFDNNPGAVVSSYDPIASEGVSFAIPNSKPTTNFQNYAAGVAFSFGHGLQAFVQYQQRVNIQDVAARMVSGGIRGAF